MTPEAQRLAIAKVCGWTRLEMPAHDADGEYGSDRFTMIRWLAPNEKRSDNPYWWKYECPNYLFDLNAMHEAEKTLLDNGGAWQQYVKELKLQSAKTGLPTFHLEAAHRAEAFCRTLNLWTD